MFNLIVSRDESFWPPKDETIQPHPMLVIKATNDLIAALFNFHQVTTGQSEDFVNYLEMSSANRDFLARRVPMASRLIWGA